VETRSTITAKATPERGRKPKLGEPDRRCAESGCDTRLTRYNRKDKCYRHQPRKRPRLRGLRRPSQR
jgi:hypothetical protein